MNPLDAHFGDYSFVKCAKCQRSDIRKNIKYRSIEKSFILGICKGCHEEEINKHSVECCICGGKFIYIRNGFVEGRSIQNHMICNHCISPLVAREARRVYGNIYRTKQGGLVSDLTLKEWLQVIHEHDGKCFYCGAEFQELDHVVPVTKGGGTTKSNCVPACKRCNMRKSDNAGIFESKHASMF